jgi:hypothetical protein
LKEKGEPLLKKPETNGKTVKVFFVGVDINALMQYCARTGQDPNEVATEAILKGIKSRQTNHTI